MVVNIVASPEIVLYDYSRLVRWLRTMRYTELVKYSWVVAKGKNLQSITQRKRFILLNVQKYWTHLFNKIGFFFLFT